jgi:hypothetical protein
VLAARALCLAPAASVAARAPCSPSAHAPQAALRSLPVSRNSAVRLPHRAPEILCRFHSASPLDENPSAPLPVAPPALSSRGANARGPGARPSARADARALNEGACVGVGTPRDLLFAFRCHPERSEGSLRARYCSRSPRRRQKFVARICSGFSPPSQPRYLLRFFLPRAVLLPALISMFAAKASDCSNLALSIAVPTWATQSRMNWTVF